MFKSILGVRLFALTLASSCLWVGCASTPEKKEVSDADKSNLYVNAANSALSEGDAIGALGFLETAEKLNPKNHYVHNARAVALYLRKDIPGALASSKKAVELKPDYSDAQNTYGRILMENGQTKEGEKHLLIAAKDIRNREAFKANTSLGILYYRQGKFEESRAYIEKAIAEAPERACIASYYRGHLNLKDGKFDKAIHDYEAASKRDCTNMPEAHLALGIALQKSGHVDQARRKFLDVQNNFPETKIAEQAMERLKSLP